MLSYCLKYRMNTECKNIAIKMTKRAKRTKSLWIQLGVRTTLSKIPLLDDMLFYILFSKNEELD